MRSTVAFPSRACRLVVVMMVVAASGVRTVEGIESQPPTSSIESEQSGKAASARQPKQVVFSGHPLDYWLERARKQQDAAETRDTVVALA